MEPGGLPPERTPFKDSMSLLGFGPDFFSEVGALASKPLETFNPNPTSNPGDQFQNLVGTTSPRGSPGFDASTQLRPPPPVASPFEFSPFRMNSYPSLFQTLPSPTSFSPGFTRGSNPDPGALQSGMWLPKIFGPKPQDAQGTQTATGDYAAGVPNSDGYVFPLPGYVGDPHKTYHVSGATDLFAPEGTPIFAMIGGTVTYSANAANGGPGGNSVEIHGSDGRDYYYAHMGDAPPALGTNITTGQTIGHVSDTGNAKGKGTHLHIGIGYGITSGSGAAAGAGGGGFDAQTFLASVLHNPPRGVPAASQVVQQPDTTSHESFVKSLLPVARAIEAQTGLPAIMTLAIAAHESGWGSAGNNMLFGVKGPGHVYQTWEQNQGPIMDSFRVFATANEAFQNFADLVGSGRYAPAYAQLQQTGDWRTFLRSINQAGYATDPIWYDKIARMANTVQSLLGN